MEWRLGPEHFLACFVAHYESCVYDVENTVL